MHSVGVMETALSRYLPVIGTAFCVSFALGLVNWVHHHAWGGVMLLFSALLLGLLLSYAAWSFVKGLRRWRARSGRGAVLFWGVAMTGFGVAMFAFSYLLVPMYDVICKHMGVNGHVGHVAKSVNHHHLVSDHPVKLQIVTNVNTELPWDVIPIERTKTIQPGETIEVHYYVRNKSAHSATVHPVLSLTPGELAQYFVQERDHHEQTTQSLAGGQSALWSMKFRLSQQIPDNVSELTLAYSLFDVAYVGHLGNSDYWRKMQRMTRGVKKSPRA